MRKLIIVTMLFTACNRMPEIVCNYSFEAAGMVVCSEQEMSPGAPAQLESIVQIIQEEVRRRYPEVPDVVTTLAKHDTLVGIGRVWYVSSCQELPGSGFLVCRGNHGALFEHERNIVFTKQYSNGCFDSLVAHEILHSIIFHNIRGEADQKHDTPWIYGDGSGETVEELSRTRINRDTLQSCIDAGKK